MRKSAPKHTRLHKTVGNSRTPDEMLHDEVGKFYDDPLGYVMFMFPWDTDTSIQIVPLPEKYRGRFPHCEYGPDEWSCEFLDDVGKQVKERKFNGRDAVEPLRFATVSGHEIGKTTLVAWLIKWIMDTRPFSRGSVTAVTDEQLRTKTWAELSKWHRLSLTEHWFEFSSSRGNMSLVHKLHPDRWHCHARTCREERSESFAGQHAPGATSFYIFDEASGIPNKIYEVREGGLTSGEPMVFDFGNGTRNSGAFYEEFHGARSHRYTQRSIDSRDVYITNKNKIQQDADDYGEDSDFFRVRWRGLFPVTGFSQFISTEHVEDCMSVGDINEREAPVVFGVDVARFGDNDSVIWARRGRDARSFEPKAYRGFDTTQLTGEIVRLYREFRDLGVAPAMIFIDGGGIGGGVVDQVRALGYPVTEVHFGGRPSDRKKYRYKSDEMWGRMREAISNQLRLPARLSQHGDRIHADLTQREYGMMAGESVVHLESKKDMAERGLASPDFGDALALTYAAEVNAAPAIFQVEKSINPLDYDPISRLLD